MSGQPLASPAAAGPAEAAWYEDWQHPEHVERFDARSRLDARNLVRNYEAFNDVRLLNERLAPARAADLLEVGCATGEFARYLRLRFPRVRYVGLDVSAPAIARAKAKYPQAAFFTVEMGRPLADTLARLQVARPAIIYSKDVIPHQVEPWAFLAELVHQASESVILRCRTRDEGETELDPERSCQYHYGGWMPYMVLNLQELVDRIRAHAPESEVVVYRHHVVLGGHNGRFLPKALYLAEAGGAETAVGLFKTTGQPGRVTIQDRPDGVFIGTWDARLRSFAQRMLAPRASGG